MFDEIKLIPYQNVNNIIFAYVECVYRTISATAETISIDCSLNSVENTRPEKTSWKKTVFHAKNRRFFSDNKKQ